MKKKKVI